VAELHIGVVYAMKYGIHI